MSSTPRRARGAALLTAAALTGAAALALASTGGPAGAQAAPDQPSYVVPVEDANNQVVSLDLEGTAGCEVEGSDFFAFLFGPDLPADGGLIKRNAPASEISDEGLYRLSLSFQDVYAVSNGPDSLIAPGTYTIRTSCVDAFGNSTGPGFVAAFDVLTAGGDGRYRAVAKPTEPEPTGSPTGTPTGTPTPDPTGSPTPTPTPTGTPTPTPTGTATPQGDLEVTDGAGNVLPENPPLTVGSQIVLAFTGLAPGLELPFSVGTEEGAETPLEVQTADAAGAARLSYTVPAGTAPGQYRLLGSTDAERVVVPFRVVADGTGPTGGSSDTGGTTSTGDASGTAGGGLPVTGLGLAALTGLAGAAAAGGGWLLLQERGQRALRRTP